MRKPKLLSQIEGLKGWREIAFIVALAQRAWPNFVLFYESCDLPGVTPTAEMAEDLAYIWGLFQDKNVDNIEDDPRVGEILDRLAENIDLLTELEEFGAVAAVYFCGLLEQSLLCRLNQEKRRAADAREQAVELVAQFIQLQAFTSLDDEDAGENELVKILDQHPLMQRELSFHGELVDWLRSNGSPAPKAILELCQLARDGDLSNLGIALDDEG